MKIRTKFVISLILLIILPAIGTTLVTSNVLSKSLNLFHAFDTYYDIFNNFSESSLTFEKFVKPYENDPQVFLTDAFIEKAQASIADDYLIVEVYENDALVQTTYTDQVEFDNFIEKWVYDFNQGKYPDEKYTLKEIHFERDDHSVIDVNLLVDSTRLELSYQTFERIFLFLFAVFNIGILSILLSWMSNPIKRSIRKLTYTTNEIGKGNLNAKLEYNENDDFEELAYSIETMRQSLKVSVEKQQILEIEKKEIISNISHDLRTPITSIRGYVQGLKDGVARSDEMQKEYLDTIEAKTYMIESLVNDLSVIAKFDQQGIIIKKQPIVLRNFLYDCVDELEKDVRKVGGNLYLHFIIKDTQIEADPEKLMRVFRNLIENAIKYRSGEPLEIVILANQDDDGVFINITDNGIGVPEEDLPKIFERFYRSDKSRNLNIKGSGIGLSICREIIEAHGGKIAASGNNESGITISIRLLNETE